MDVFEFHSEIHSSFDNDYRVKKTRRQRLAIWESFILKYSNKEFHALDAGSGSGVLTRILSTNNRSVVGVDASKKMYELSVANSNDQKYSNINYKNCRLEDFENENKFDLIICSSVLEYVENINDIIGMFSNLMNENGKLIFSLPNGKSIYRKIEGISSKLFDKPDYFKFLINIKSIDQTEELIKKFDFKIIESHFYGEKYFESLLNKYFSSIKYFYHNYLIVLKKC